MNRVVVVGTSGSGKTTVSSVIAEKLGLRHIELDSIHWAPNWTELPGEGFREKVIEATNCDGWAIDGNYGSVRDITWTRADTVVWLDLPFRVVFWRILRRTITRVIRGEKLWNGNVERLSALVGPDAMPLWVIKTYWRWKREYPELFARPEFSHLDVVRLRSVREIDDWLCGLKKP